MRRRMSDIKSVLHALLGNIGKSNSLKVHITPLTKFRPERGQNVTCKIFPESEL